MNREELRAIVRKSNSTTLVANRMRKALGLHEIWRNKHSGHAHSRARAKYVKRNRYRHAKQCMKQKHGVKL